MQANTKSWIVRLPLFRTPTVSILSLSRWETRFSRILFHVYLVFSILIFRFRLLFPSMFEFASRRVQKVLNLRIDKYGFKVTILRLFDGLKLLYDCTIFWLCDFFYCPSSVLRFCDSPDSFPIPRFFPLSQQREQTLGLAQLPTAHWNRKSIHGCVPRSLQMCREITLF